MVEGPWGVQRPFYFGEGGVVFFVDEEPEGGGLPFDGVDMKIVREVRIVG